MEISECHCPSVVSVKQPECQLGDRVRGGEEGLKCSKLRERDESVGWREGSWRGGERKRRVLTTHKPVV
jgi:hypothetical protein